MRDYIFSFQDEDQERDFLEMAQARGVKPKWVAVDPNPEFDGEHKFADEDVWNALSKCIQETLEDSLSEEENQPPWPRTSLEQWEQESRRQLILLAVKEFACIGDQLPKQASILRAFREGQLPNP